MSSTEIERAKKFEKMKNDRIAKLEEELEDLLNQLRNEKDLLKKLKDEKNDLENKYKDL